jgi:hypothetical protein
MENTPIDISGDKDVVMVLDEASDAKLPLTPNNHSFDPILRPQPDELNCFFNQPTKLDRPAKCIVHAEHEIDLDFPMLQDYPLATSRSNESNSPRVRTVVPTCKAYTPVSPHQSTSSPNAWSATPTSVPLCPRK